MSDDAGVRVVPRDAVRIDIVAGPDAALSPELQVALANVARVLAEQEDVQGFMLSAGTAHTSSESG